MANEKWVVDLELNQGGLKSQVAKAEAELNKLGRKTNIQSSVSADLKSGISGFGQNIKQEIPGSGLNNALIGALGVGTVFFAKSLSKGLLNVVNNIGGKLVDKLKIDGVLDTGDPLVKNVLGPLAGISRDATNLMNIIKGVKTTSGGITVLQQSLGLAGSSVKPLIAGLSTLATFANPITLVAVAIGAIAIAAVAAIPVMAGLQKAAMNFAMPYVQAYANVQALKNKLKQLGATASDVKSTFALAKLPGLSKESAASSVAGFMAGGLTVEESQALTASFGKAAGSAETLQNITRQFSQSLGKGKVQAEELNNILDQSPMIGMAMEKAFGTRSAEEFQKSGRTVQELLAGIAMELNKMPAQNSAQSSIDNLNDAITGLKASFGEGIATGFLPFIESLTVKLDELVENGSIQKWGEQLSVVFDSGALEMTIDGLLAMGGVAVWLAEQINNLGNFFVKTGQLIGDAMNFIGGSIKFVYDKITFLLGPLATMIKLIDIISKWKTGKSIFEDIGKAALSGAGQAAMGPLGFLAGLGGIGAIDTRQGRKKKLKDLEKKNSRDFGTTLSDLAKKGGKKEDITGGRDIADIQKQQLDYLRDIANNTKPDLQRSILGGGQLGQLGITPMELAGGAKKRAGKGNQKIEKAVYDLLDGFYQAIQDGNREAQRVGWMP